MSKTKFVKKSIPYIAIAGLLAYILSTQRKKLGVFASPVAPIITLHPDNKTKRMV